MELILHSFHLLYAYLLNYCEGAKAAHRRAVQPVGASASSSVNREAERQNLEKIPSVFFKGNGILLKYNYLYCNLYLMYYTQNTDSLFPLSLPLTLDLLTLDP